MKVASALTLSAVMVISGCKSKPAVAIRNQDGSITNPDGSVTYPAGSQQAQAAEQPSAGAAPAGSVTNSDGSVTYPASSDAAKSSSSHQTGQQAAPAPATTTAAAPVERSAPAPAPAPVRQAITVPSGTRVEVSLSQTLSAKDNNVGDTFTGVLARPVETTGGSTVFSRGDRVEGRVVAAKGRGRFKGAGDLGIELTSIAGHDVNTTEYEKVIKGKGKRTAGFIGGGGGLGALIGGLAGGGKGALIGGLAGAGAGTAAGAYTGNKNVVIPAETVVVFRTTSSMSVR